MPLRRLLVHAVLLLAAVFADPRAAAAQPVQMCSNQPVPQGYVVTATTSRSECPGYYSSGYNSLTIRIPGDSVSVCTALTQRWPGYVVTSQTSRSDCPGYYSSGSNSATWRRVGDPPAPPVPAPASGAFAALDQYDRSVFRRMKEMETWLRLETPTHHAWLHKTAQGTTARTTLAVEGGQRYTLVAVCDDDCTDMDLRVLDGRYLLAEDVSTDAHATVALTPARGGQLTVEVVMAACAQSPCHFAVGVYETPRAGALPPRRPPGGDVRVTPRPRP